MDADEITRLLDQAHPYGLTWESHLAFVEQMEQWDLSRILDFQESLFAHLIAGTWIATWADSTAYLPSGTRVSLNRVPSQVDVTRQRLEVLEAQHDGSAQSSTDIAVHRADLVELDAIGDRGHPQLVPAMGEVGIPVDDSYAETWAKGVIAWDGKPSRRRLLKVLNEESFTNVRDLVRVLRTAAWAHLRKTGSLPKGVLPSREEELHRSGEMRRFRIVQVLERDDDRIETVGVWSAPSREYLAARHGSFAPVARALAARAVGKPRLVDLGAVDDGPLPSGVLVDEWAAISEPPSSLLTEARALLSGDSRRRTTPPLIAERFWSLIDLLEGDVRNEEVLISALSDLPPDDIRAFSESLADALFALDRPELTDDPDDDKQIPMSEDVFLYFRCSVVAAGRAAFDRVLREGVLKESEWDDGGSGEGLLSVAAVAFERATGKEWDHDTHVSYETGSNREAWGTRRSLQDRGWDGWVSVRSRALTSDGQVETVRHWTLTDPQEAEAQHLHVERECGDRTEVRIVDHLKLSSAVSPGIMGALVQWVRVAS
jgi:hypothetical protein